MVTMTLKGKILNAVVTLHLVGEGIRIFEPLGDFRLKIDRVLPIYNYTITQQATSAISLPSCTKSPTTDTCSVKESIGLDNIKQNYENNKTGFPALQNVHRH